MTHFRERSNGRTVCPYCGRENISLTSRGFLARHGLGRPCPASGLTPHQAQTKMAFEEHERARTEREERARCMATVTHTVRTIPPITSLLDEAEDEERRARERRSAAPTEPDDEHSPEARAWARATALLPARDVEVALLVLRSQRDTAEERLRKAAAAPQGAHQEPALPDDGYDTWWWAEDGYDTAMRELTDCLIANAERHCTPADAGRIGTPEARAWARAAALLPARDVEVALLVLRSQRDTAEERLRKAAAAPQGAGPSKLAEE